MCRKRKRLFLIVTTLLLAATVIVGNITAPLQVRAEDVMASEAETLEEAETVIPEKETETPTLDEGGMIEDTSEITTSEDETSISDNSIIENESSEEVVLSGAESKNDLLGEEDFLLKKGLSNANNAIQFLRISQQRSEMQYSYIGSEIVMHAEFAVAAGTNLGKTILRITLPKTHIIDGSFSLTDIPEANGKPIQISKTVQLEGDNYVLEYEMDLAEASASQALNIDIPIKFTTDAYITPIGFKIPVTPALLDETGLVLKEGSPYIMGEEDEAGNKIGLMLAKPSATLIKNGSFERTSDGDSVSGWNSHNNGYLQSRLGKEDPAKPGYLVTDKNQLRPIKYSVTTAQTYAPTAPPGAGDRYMEKGIFEITLPEGATFYPEDNPDWQYDEPSRTATYIYTPAEGSNLHLKKVDHSKNVVLTLYFPGAKIDSSAKANAKLTFIPKNRAEGEPDVIVTPSATDFIIKAYEYRLEVGKTYLSTEGTVLNPLFDDATEKENLKGSWKITAKNPNTASTNQGETNIYNLVLTDYGLDEKLYFTELQLNQHGEDAFVGTVDLVVKRESGEEETLRSNISLNQSKQTIALDTETTDNYISEISLKATSDSYLKPGKSITFGVSTKFKNPQEQLIHTGPGSGATSANASMKDLHNYAKVSGSSMEGGRASEIEQKLTTSVYMRVVSRQAQAYLITKGSSNDFVVIGDEVTHNVALNIWKQYDKTTFEFEKIISLMPAGCSYIPESATIVPTSTAKSHYDGDWETITGQIEPEIIENYKDSGRDALIWKLPTLTTHTLPGVGLVKVLDLEYKITPTLKTNPGSATINTYLSVKNTDKVVPDYYIGGGSDATLDKYDVNDNGQTDDWVAYGYSSFQYLAPKILQLGASSKGSLDSDFATQAYGVIGSEAEYKLNVQNLLDTKLKEFKLLNILPYEDDANGSAFATPLRGPVTVSDGFRVGYTTIPYDKTAGADAFYHAVWQAEQWYAESAIEDFSEVTAFIILLDLDENDQTIPFPAKGKMEATVPVSVPNDIDVAGKTAYNSFTVGALPSIGTAQLNTISNPAALTITSQTVEGYVFNDKNADGLLNTAEDEILADYLVELLDSDGKPAKNLDGEPIQAKTDARGYYSMKVPHAGDYKIRVAIPEGSTIIETNNNLEWGSALTEVVENPKDTYWGLSNTFTFSHNNKVKRSMFTLLSSSNITPDQTVRQNAGFKGIATEDVTADKVWVNGPAEKPDIQLQLYANGKTKGQPATLSNGTTSYTWENMPITNAKGEPITYTVDEVNVPEHYTKTVEGLTITNTYNAPDIDAPVPPVQSEKPTPPAPKTGEYSSLPISIALLLVSGSCVVLSVIISKQRKSKIK